MMGYASFLVLLLVLVQGIASTIRHGQTTTTFNVAPANPKPSATSTLNASCARECKYGDCKNGTCVCIKIFQGDSCNQPKPWFLVVACVAGTILVIIVGCIICCLCSCGSGKEAKVEHGSRKDRI